MIIFRRGKGGSTRHYQGGGSMDIGSLETFTYFLISSLFILLKGIVIEIL